MSVIFADTGRQVHAAFDPPRFTVKNMYHACIHDVLSLRLLPWRHMARQTALIDCSSLAGIDAARSNILCGSGVHARRAREAPVRPGRRSGGIGCPLDAHWTLIGRSLDATLDATLDSIKTRILQIHLDSLKRLNYI